ncbi:hypothetical protein, partial [Bradyrhizobium sp. NAS96.2]|uniref:hypothetical protein n=1 Tax=Bradyrhizobium sp. NAS96.2 TaxID=1680160 RepID=UPI00095F7235
MADLSWQDLLRCYDHVEFAGDREGVLTIANAEILNTILSIDADESTSGDLNFYPTNNISGASIGDKIAVHVGAPKLSIGILAQNLDGLLSAPKGFLDFPVRFYVIDGRLSDRDTSTPQLKSYRAVVSLIKLLADAATFLDREEQKLFFFKDGKVEVPIRYSAA